MSKTVNSTNSSQKTIAVNRKARHEYTLEQYFEAGLALHGWEIKSIRAGKIQIAESYVILKKGEAWLVGSTITPLLSASTHVHADPTRSRKLLLHRRELNTLIGHIERKGYTLIPLSVYWSHGRIKLEIALAQGKKSYDKRETEKNRDWARQKQRLNKQKV
jgi:SsrA-binding protein